MHGERRKQKADDNSHQYGRSNAQPHMQGQQIAQLRHKGGQAGSEQGRVDMPSELHMMSPGIYPYPKQDRQNVERVFPPQPVARIDKECGHGGPREGNLLRQNQQLAQRQHQSRIHKCRAHASHHKKVRDQSVVGQHNLLHPLQDPHGTVTEKRRGGKCRNGKIDKIFHYIFFFHGCQPL